MCNVANLPLTLDMCIRSHSPIICIYIHQHCSVNSCDDDDDNDGDDVDCDESFDVVWMEFNGISAGSWQRNVDDENPRS